MPETAAAAPASQRSRKRAILACQQCHSRKVRCNVMQSGPPCVNCVQDGVRCEIVDRGRRRGRHRIARLLAQRTDSIHVGQALPLSPPPPPALSPDFATFSATTFPAPAAAAVCTTPEQTPERLEANSTRQATTTQTHGSEPHGTDYSAILDEDRDEGGEDTAVLYAGDQQGLGFVVDICQPKRTFPGNHFVVPRAAAQSALLPEDVAALQAKGCFSLPSEAVQSALLRCYFHHVHPFLPILDAGQFVCEYDSGAPLTVNLLLLWSMFFAATNFLGDETVQQAGFSSRKAMKNAMYRRAKSLYDADYEKNKIPLIQSVILLAFWYVDAEDRNGSWHWIGIAISLCQTIGLHRSLLLETARKQSSAALLSDARCRLWRLIWWTCYLRDTWLSYGMGRPTRISRDDCDTPLPTADDVALLWSTGGASTPAAAHRLFPAAATRHSLAQLWPHLLETTLSLGQILTTHYRVTSPPPPAAIDEDWARLRRCSAAFPAEDACGDDPVAQSHLYHLYIYYEAAVVALHRPYLGGRPGEQRSRRPADASARTLSLRRAALAASNINGVLNKIMTSRLTDVCQPMMVTSVIPALQIHLFMSVSVSDSSLTRSLARHQLDIGMIFLGALRRTYWAADLIHALFFKAKKKLVASGVWDSPDTRSQDSDSSRSPVQTQALDGETDRLSGSTAASFGTPTPLAAASSPVDSVDMPVPAAAPSCDRSDQTHHVPRGVSIDLDGMDMLLFHDLFPVQYDLLSSTSGTGIWGAVRASSKFTTSPVSTIDLNLILDHNELANLL